MGDGQGGLLQEDSKNDMPDSWSASYKRGYSGSFGRLLVIGQCAAKGGETFILIKHSSSASDPSTLVLEKLRNVPTAFFHTQGTRWITVTYEALASDPYKQVRIVPDGIMIMVEDVFT
jgi:hypothetical protein